jgi:hypothetical protein
MCSDIKSVFTLQCGWKPNSSELTVLLEQSFVSIYMNTSQDIDILAKYFVLTELFFISFTL